MGAQIIGALAGPILGKVLGGNPAKDARKAQAAETARLDAEAKASADAAAAERKVRKAQRPQTDVIFGGANTQGTGIGNLGG